MNHGLIFDLQRCCPHDGPGLRTTVFLKGCNLRCHWCHNPESWHMQPELMHYPQKCIGCGKCFSLCSLGIHNINSQGGHQIDRAKCTACGICARQCFAKALEICGQERSVEDIMSQVRMDAAFYKNSGGGMTISGGEPLLQPEFTRSLLKAAKKEGIHAALDTAGDVDFALFERVLPYVDLLLYDCKHMDSIAHKDATGVGNERILDNLRKLGHGNKTIWLRVPVIPGFNDGEEYLQALREFGESLPAVTKLDLLEYHNFGEGKRKALGG